jgi:hypothetical protein
MEALEYGFLSVNVNDWVKDIGGLS